MNYGVVVVVVVVVLLLLLLFDRIQRAVFSTAWVGSANGELEYTGEQAAADDGSLALSSLRRHQHFAKSSDACPQLSGAGVCALQRLGRRNGKQRAQIPCTNARGPLDPGVALDLTQNPADAHKSPQEG
jgi:hypothetical protein